MTALVIAIVAVLVVAFVAGVLLARRSRRADGVASFRRQIDALSPEARRPVVDEVQRLGEQKGDAGDGAS
jgi:archaellum component FlaG (FlaF/FlaG flagellin family)